MMIIDAQFKLIEFFGNNSIFNLKEDYKKLALELKEINQDEVIEGVFRAACERLQQNNLITLVAPDVWALVKPITNYDQNVLINYRVAFYIADTLNDIADIVKNDDLKVDVLSITEKDICNLLSIIEDLRQKVGI